MRSVILALLYADAIFSLPTIRGNSNGINNNPVPGESEIYVDYLGRAPPYPATNKAPIRPISSNPQGPDDLLFQDLLSAEWIIYSFYQYGVEKFSASDFVKEGYSNATYDAICEIRDNEAGHLKIFQDSISNSSIKPGACTYNFGYNSTSEYLAVQAEIEIASEVFLTGLVMEGRTNATKGALVAIAETESRHNSWTLMEIFKQNPFVGPSDTVYPYANQILGITTEFIVDCPKENPLYPSFNQELPTISFNKKTSDGKPGSKIQLIFSKDPQFQDSKEYFAVFYHGVETITMPFDRRTNTTHIPPFDGQGIILVAIADEEDAPRAESVVAGPLLLLEQPASLLKALDS